jgi:hypothetical protein
LVVGGWLSVVGGRLSVVGKHVSLTINRQLATGNRQPPTTFPHSYLNATIGSTLVARSAGTKQAISATRVNNNAMEINVSGMDQPLNL